MTLNEIALKYEADKSTEIHGYTLIYDKLLSSMREKPINLLEIGVWRGASMKMWEEYFPNGNIYGMDNDNYSNQFNIGRVKVIIGDQRNKDDLSKIIKCCPTYDIIIDDGSHKAEDFLYSFSFMFKYIRPGGYYVIEDLHTSSPDIFTPVSHIPGSMLMEKILGRVIFDFTTEYHSYPFEYIQMYPKMIIFKKKENVKC